MWDTVNSAISATMSPLVLFVKIMLFIHVIDDSSCRALVHIVLFVHRGRKAWIRTVEICPIARLVAAEINAIPRVAQAPDA